MLAIIISWGGCSFSLLHTRSGLGSYLPVEQQRTFFNQPKPLLETKILAFLSRVKLK